MTDDTRFTPDGALGALLVLAERHQRPDEALEQAFSRVVRQTYAGRRLYNALREADSARPTLRLGG